MFPFSRRRNMFGPIQEEEQKVGYGINPELQANFTPPDVRDMPYIPQESLETTAQKEYRRYLTGEDTPKVDDFKSSKGDRLGAILAGIAGEDYDTINSIKNRRYNLAQQNYNLKGSRLANLHKLDIESADTAFKNRIAGRKLDIDEAAEDRLYNDSLARQKNYESQIKSRDAEAATKGYTPTTDVSGNRIYTRVGKDGKTETINTGIKVKESPAESDIREINKAGKLSNIVLGREKNFFESTRDARKEDQKGIIDYRNLAINDRADKAVIERRARDAANRLANQTNQKELIDYRNIDINKRFDKAMAERAARDSTNPNRVFAARQLAYRELISENPDIADEIDLDKGTHTPGIDALVKEKTAKYGVR